MRISRRNLLKAGGGAVAGMAVKGCSSGDPYSPDKPPVPGAERWRRFQESSVTTACGQCAAACGVRVRVVEGRAVRIDGDPDNPINRGGIGPRGIAGLQVTYDPDRIREPLVRRHGRLEPIAWDDALEMLGERLAVLRDAGEAERLLLLCGRERGMVHDLWRRFAYVYGTPNFFDSSARDGGGLRLANELMQGVADIPAYDWGRSRTILSLGSGLLESSCQAVYLARLSAHLRRGRPGERARIVHVEPSYSRTAANADQWISIAPNTYAAFALGLAHVLVRDGLDDRAFVEAYTAGFDDWTDAAGVPHVGFRTVLREKYAPEAVAATCGVEARAIERLAHELAVGRPSLAIIDPQTTLATGGLQAAMAVLALNALLGALQRPGGVVEQAAAPLASWSEPELDDAALASLARPAIVERTPFGALAAGEVAATLLAAPPYPIDTALLYYSNPAYAWPDPSRWEQALQAIPFVVSMSPFLDDTTARVADLVLPDHTYLERFEDAQPAPSIGTAVFGVRQPAIEPLYDTRSSADVAIDLARAIGGSVGDAFPWKEFRFAFAQRAAGLQSAERGSIVEDTPQAFFRELFRAGFWADEDRDADPTAPRFRTDSGKFEFVSARMRVGIERFAAERGLETGALLDQLGYPPSLDEACQPHGGQLTGSSRSPAAALAADYPLVLEAYKPGTYAEGSGANLPLLQELVTEPGAAAWSTTATIAPETAARLGLTSGDRVTVESPTGAIVVPLRVVRGVRPDAVRVPRGGGHSEFGRFARGRGANVMRLIAQTNEPIGGFPILHGTRVRIRKETA